MTPTASFPFGVDALVSFAGGLLGGPASVLWPLAVLLLAANALVLAFAITGAASALWRLRSWRPWRPHHLRVTLHSISLRMLGDPEALARHLSRDLGVRVASVRVEMVDYRRGAARLDLTLKKN